MSHARIVVYVLTNERNGKQYVGQTRQLLKKRVAHHAWASTLKTGTPIAHAAAKYGMESFKLEILQKCNSEEEADSAEIFFATSLGTFVPRGYNLRAGRLRGVVHPQVNARIAAALRGRRLSAEHRRKLSIAHTGIPLSAAARAKLSRLWKGRPLPLLARINSRLATERTYTLVDPGGQLVTIVNMAAFCREHGLSRFKMSEVVHGRRAAYRGWRRAELQQ